MVKLNILNMKEFLKVVNQCEGKVNLVYPDGRKEDINQAYGIQRELQDKYKKNKEYLTVWLDIPVVRDYFNIIYYYAGEC